MKISVDIVNKIDLKPVMKSIDAKTRKALAKATVSFVTSLKRRTDKGYGLKGKFKAYSKEYQKYKASKNKAPNLVNLKDTASMMLSLTSKIKGDTAYVYFNGSENNKKAYFNNKVRPFFGIIDDEKKEIDKIFSRYLK